jgi:hypothetical protein
MIGKLTRKSEISNVMFGLFGAFSFITAIGTQLGWARRAPDVVNGDLINLPNGFVLLLLAAALQFGNFRLGIYMTTVTLVCAFEAILMQGLRNPFFMGWLLIWAAFLAHALLARSRQVPRLEGAIERIN